MTEHEIPYTAHRPCECGIPGLTIAWAKPSERYAGRYEAHVTCFSCDRQSAAGYSRHRAVAIQRAWRYWDDGKLEEAS